MIESGNYLLEIVDILGSVVKVKEFVADVNQKDEYIFEVPVQGLASGNYFLIMKSPTDNLSVGFQIQR